LAESVQIRLQDVQKSSGTRSLEDKGGFEISRKSVQTLEDSGGDG
jgi:hypothetical protein